MASSTTLRVSTGLHGRIASLAKTRGERLQDIIDQAITIMERAQFWDEVDAYYEQLRADPEAWAEELAERKLWDVTLKDGLEPEPEW